MSAQTNRPTSAANRDRKLWMAYLQGQKKSLGKIFLMYHNQLFRYGISLIRNRSLVEDSIQELFLKLWENRTNINNADSVEFYLLFSLRRILLREKKKMKSIYRRNGLFIKEEDESIESIEERIIGKEQRDERYLRFLKAQVQLTPRQKEVLYLRIRHGMTNTEISQILGVSNQRVKNCMYESIKHLKNEIYHTSTD